MRTSYKLSNRWDSPHFRRPPCHIPELDKKSFILGSPPWDQRADQKIMVFIGMCIWEEQSTFLIMIVMFYWTERTIVSVFTQSSRLWLLSSASAEILKIRECLSEFAVYLWSDIWIRKWHKNGIIIINFSRSSIDALNFSTVLIEAVNNWFIFASSVLLIPRIPAPGPSYVS